MDMEAAKQMSREGFAGALDARRRMLADLQPGDRAGFDQLVASTRETLAANGIPINADTAKVFFMATMLPSVELLVHHPEIEGTCLEDHVILPQLVATLLLDSVT